MKKTAFPISREEGKIILQIGSWEIGSGKLVLPSCPKVFKSSLVLEGVFTSGRERVHCFMVLVVEEPIICRKVTSSMFHGTFHMLTTPPFPERWKIPLKHQSGPKLVTEVKVDWAPEVSGFRAPVTGWEKKSFTAEGASEGDWLTLPYFDISCGRVLV